MGKALLLEPVGGIAGDMFCAAAVDLGIDPKEIEAALLGLGLPGWKLLATPAERHAIHGTHIKVEVDEAAGHAHRDLAEIRRMIDRCHTLPEPARATAQAIFTVIGEAEAKIHAVPLEAVHFHEVGAVDSIVDVCAAAFVHQRFGAPEVYSKPPPLGSGQVRTMHGPMPVPAPATLEILREVAVRFEGVGELTTPTGAAILKVLAKVGPLPPCTVLRVGYGMGTRELQDRPNVLRASLVELAAELPEDAGVWVLEANLDDATPQLLGALVETLLEQGALDAYVVPAVMKKGRPGHLLTALCPPELRLPLTELLLRESTTLGVRYHLALREVLERRSEPVQTPYGTVRVKLGLRLGKVVNAQPEFEDCRRLSRELGVPLKEVLAAAAAAYRGR